MGGAAVGVGECDSQPNAKGYADEGLVLYDAMRCGQIPRLIPHPAVTVGRALPEMSRLVKCADLCPLKLVDCAILHTSELSDGTVLDPSKQVRADI